MKEEVLMPIFDYVIVKRDESKKSVILRPENQDPRAIPMLELVVLFAGPDCLNVKAGDMVVFDPSSSISFAYNHQDYMVFTEGAVRVIVAPLRKISPVPEARRLPH